MTKQILEGANESGKFTSRVAWIAGANFLSFILATATPLFIANLLSPAQVGLYKQAFLIISIATTVLNMQMASGGYYFIPQMPEKRFQIAVNILFFYFLVGSVVLAVFLFYPQWAASVFADPEIIQHIPIVGVAILLGLMSSTLDLFPLALGDARTAASFIILSQISRSGLMIGAMILYRNEHAIIWSAVVQCVFQLGLIFWYLRRHYTPWRAPLDWPLFKAQIANAIPYGAGSIVFNLHENLHNLFVSHFFTPAIYAIYSVGCFQLPFLSLLSSSFSAVMFPEIAWLGAKGDYRRIVAVWSNSMRKLSLAFIPGCILLYVVRHNFFAFLFPKAYAGSASIFAVYLLSILMTMPQTEPILRAFADLKYFRLKLSLFLLPISFAALFAGVKLGGLTGVITVVVCIQAFDLMITIRLISRRIGFTKSDLMVLAPMLWTSLAGIPAGGGAFLVQWFLPHLLPLIKVFPGPRMFAAVSLLLCALVFLPIYLTGAFVLGAITESDIEELAPVILKIQRLMPSGLWRRVAELRGHLNA